MRVSEHPQRADRSAAFRPKHARHIARALGVVVLVAASGIGILAASQAALCENARTTAVFSDDQTYYAWTESQDCSFMGEDMARVIVDRVSFGNVLPWNRPKTVLQLSVPSHAVDVMWDGPRQLRVTVGESDRDHVTAQVAEWNDISIVYIVSGPD